MEEKYYEDRKILYYTRRFIMYLWNSDSYDGVASFFGFQKDFMEIYSILVEILNIQ